MTVCKRECTQDTSTVSGWSADKSRHQEKIMVSQQPKLTKVVDPRALMYSEVCRLQVEEPKSAQFTYYVLKFNPKRIHILLLSWSVYLHKFPDANTYVLRPQEIFWLCQKWSLLFGTSHSFWQKTNDTSIITAKNNRPKVSSAKGSCFLLLLFLSFCLSSLFRHHSQRAGPIFWAYGRCNLFDYYVFLGSFLWRILCHFFPAIGTRRLRAGSQVSTGRSRLDM